MAVEPDDATAPPVAPDGSGVLTRRQLRIVLPALMLGMFLASLDQSITATALPTIVGDLGGLNKLSWIVTVYMLASTVTTPIYGKLGDLFGRKVIFQVAVLIFLVGSILSGFSHTIVELIVFRLVQGLGAGGIITSVMSIVGEILAPRERGKYQAYFVVTFTFANLSGPAVGGLLTQDLSWRWCFYVNVPIGIVALIITGPVLNLTFTRVKHRIDYVGIALFSTGITALLLATVWGGGLYRWTSPQMIALIVGGIAVIAAFIWWEQRAAEPLVPIRLFANRTFSVMNAAGFLSSAAMFGTIVYLPLFLQLVTGVGPLASGVLIMPQSVASSLAGVIVGRRVSKTGRYKIYPLVGGTIMTVGLILLTTLHASTPRLLSALYMAIFGLGAGLLIPVMLMAIQNSVAKEDLGTATSSNLFFRQMGSSLGVAVFGSIMNARLWYWFPRLIPHGVGSKISVASVAFSPAAVRHLAHNIQLGIVESFGRSLHVVFLCAVPLAALTLPAFALLREIPLRTGAHVVSNEFEAELDVVEVGEPVAPAPVDPVTA